MAPDRGRNHAAGFQDSRQSAGQDFDPEADEFLDGSSDADSDASKDGDPDLNSARDHYADVGKSKLRQPKTAALGAQYRGSRIMRHAAAADEEGDDPFSRGFVDSGSDDDHTGAFVEGSTGASGEEEDDSDAGIGSESETSDADHSDNPTERAIKPTSSTGVAEERYQVLKMLAKDQKDVATRLAQSTKMDAEKGRAVKKQRIAFDALLGTRIKLQKALIGANTIAGSGIGDLKSERDEPSSVVEQAEAAAFNLWSSLTNLREETIVAKSGEKRKLSGFTSNTTTKTLWSHMQEQEEFSRPHRNATLQRWSIKARSTTVQPQHALLNKTEHRSTVIDTLQEHISNPSRMLQRAHTPRSCAPLQLANKMTEDPKIYDDGDFYGILLKELLEQRSQDSATAANIDLNFNLQREAKTRKNVDTKASKGRKLRYTVHEKLQNFMAPEDRRTWAERQSEELFGSLFGQSLGLAEAMIDSDGMVSDGEENEDVLMLFRT